MIIRIFDPTEPGLQASMYLTTDPASLSGPTSASRSVSARTRPRRAIPRLRSVVGLFMSAGTIGACTPRPRVETPIPPPVSVAPESISVVPTHTPRSLRSDSAIYRVTSTVITTQSLPSTPGRTPDTASFQEDISAILLTDRDPRITVRLRSDSGYRLPAGRTLAPELATTFKQSPTVTASAIAKQSPITIDSSTTSCQSPPTLLSPLIASSILRAILQNANESPRRGDSLTYSMCFAGVPLKTSVSLQSEALLQNLTTKIIGSVTADSTRVLPMRISGRFFGDVRPLFQSLTQQLPEMLIITLTLNLTFESSQRMQAMTQQISTTLSQYTSHPH